MGPTHRSGMLKRRAGTPGARPTWAFAGTRGTGWEKLGIPAAWVWEFCSRRSFYFPLWVLLLFGLFSLSLVLPLPSGPRCPSIPFLCIDSQGTYKPDVSSRVHCRAWMLTASCPELTAMTSCIRSALPYTAALLSCMGHCPDATRKHIPTV